MNGCWNTCQRDGDGAVQPLIRVVLMLLPVTARLKAKLAGGFKPRGGRRQDEKCSAGAK
jgi:hypothetical protein